MIDNADFVTLIRSWRGSAPDETRRLFAKAADIIERQRCAIGDYNETRTELIARIVALKEAVAAHKQAQYPTQSAAISEIDQQLYSAVASI